MGELETALEDTTNHAVISGQQANHCLEGSSIGCIVKQRTNQA